MPNKELRTTHINITFTEFEKEKIEQFTKASNETTREFNQNTVFQKIRHLEHH